MSLIGSIPEGIHLELQPAERLINEAANGLFEEIEEVLVERCEQLLEQTGSIRGLTNYHWWPRAA